MPFPTSIVHPSGAKLTLVPSQVLVKLPATRATGPDDTLSALGLVPLDAQGEAGPAARGARADAMPHASINNTP